MRSIGARAGASLGVLLGLVACTTGRRPGPVPAARPGGSAGTTPAAGSGTRGPSTPGPPPTTPPTALPPAPDRAHQVLAAMSAEQRVGQLLMVGCPSAGPSAATLGALRAEQVGSVILAGTNASGAAHIAALTAGLQQQAPAGVGLFVATDQEGGQVLRLQGPGFAPIPSAVTQGDWAPGVLSAAARHWGQQLRLAGVNVDLAPVLDTVPPGGGPNPPIGDLDRNYGTDPQAVSSHGTAVVQGLAAAGVTATGKHFPGLGRVSANTDYRAGVLDTQTTRHDPYLAPFAAAVRSGVPFMMISTAIYTRIDPDRPAAFSPTVVTGMLRGDLGFTGVIISDDLGIAGQVAGYPVADRAVDFVAAGGDLVLTVDATQAATMTSALLARAAADAPFRARVDAAALAVLTAKQRAGLLG